MKKLIIIFIVSLSIMLAQIATAGETGVVYNRDNNFIGYNYSLIKDTPWDIHEKYYGETTNEKVWEKILKPNGIKNPRNIPDGTVLFLSVNGMKTEKILPDLKPQLEKQPPIVLSPPPSPKESREINLLSDQVKKLDQTLRSYQSGLNQLPTWHQKTEQQISNLEERIKTMEKSNGKLLLITLGVIGLSGLLLLVLLIELFLMRRGFKKTVKKIKSLESLIASQSEKLEKKLNDTLEHTDTQTSSLSSLLETIDILKKEMIELRKELSEQNGPYIDFWVFTHLGERKYYRLYPRIDECGRFYTPHSTPEGAMKTESREVLINTTRSALEAMEDKDKYKDCDITLIRDYFEKGNLIEMRV